MMWQCLNAIPTTIVAPPSRTLLRRSFAGHSKWSNIKHQKGKNDAARSKVVTKALRVLSTALREAKGDVTHFKVLQAKALAARAGCTKANLDKALAPQKDDKTIWEKILWECTLSNYCFVVECLSDNRNRTAPLVKHAFTKNGGAMGKTGSVMWAFDEVGMIEAVPVKTGDEVVLLTEECFETFFEGAAEAGADDVEYDEASNSLVVVCGKTDLSSVTDAVRKLVGGFEYEIVSSEITFLPKDTVSVPEDDDTFLAVLDVLEDLDDVQNVYHNGEV